MTGKTMYAFGDSIIYGHTEPETSFLKMISDENDINLSMYAKNGASVIQSDNDILTQVQNAPSVKPNVIVFDGYTNDAYEKNMNILGNIQGSTAMTFDIDTFCGGFEKIIYTMKRKWDNVPIIFVTIHKSSARNWDIQCKMRELAIEMCNDWGVEIVDIFRYTEFDTRDSIQMEQYIIGGEGSHPNESGCRKFYMPLVTKKLKSIL